MGSIDTNWSSEGTDVTTIRHKHKLKVNLFSLTEYILCGGESQRMEACRFFWKNVTCPQCLKVGRKI